MKDTIENILKQMTLEEKATLLTGDANMLTHAIERLGIPALHLADGPHGTRLEPKKTAPTFPICAT